MTAQEKAQGRKTSDGRQAEDPEDADSDPEDEIEVSSLGDLALEPDLVKRIQESLAKFVEVFGTVEAAGEAVYGALFESAPSLQAAFTSPRAVQAVRFVSGLNSLVGALDNPPMLKVLTETQGFLHLNKEVTVPRIIVFRDALLDLLEAELPDDSFEDGLREGWKVFFNYFGGGLVYVQTHYADRLRVLKESWAKANNKELVTGGGSVEEDNADGGQKKQTGIQKKEAQAQPAHQRRRSLANGASAAKRKLGFRFHAHHEDVQQRVALKGEEGGSSGSRSGSGEVANLIAQTQVPKCFMDMFEFNAAVMGYSDRAWIPEILASFENIVVHVANSARVQQECSLIALRIAKCTTGPVELAEFKSCMLASLRSMLPQTWDSSCEVAWNWMWDNVARVLRQFIGKPSAWEKALGKLWESLGEEESQTMRMDIYRKFFVDAPSGQDFFKQSSTRLHFIADKILMMTLELFRNPWNMVEDISALGLHHVAYGIPTDLFAPFVSSCVQVMQGLTHDATTLEAFRWSLGLISDLLVRTITEGSTIVMKAINVNSTKQLKKAISCAPRGERGRWLLVVQVGTHSISPLSWALESGNLDAAKAILEDLLTIRADRERYYYGVDELFHQHPDIVNRIGADAPSLLPTLLGGMVWRSRQVTNGVRRVNYYLKHLLVNPEGRFSDALGHLVEAKDPNFISHPVIIMISDMLWAGIVRDQLILSKIWFLVSLLVFMLSQTILPKMPADVLDPDQMSTRMAIFVCRMFMYTFTMPYLIFQHIRDSSKSFWRGDTFRVLYVPVPNYWQDPYRSGGMVLAMFLICMCATEPFLWCLASSTQGFPTTECDAADSEFMADKYSVFCMFAMGIHWLLLIDLAVFNTGLSAFVLICTNVMSEIGRFLIALVFLLVTAASAISVLHHHYEEMQDVPMAALALFAITIRLYEDDWRDLQEDPVLLTAVFIFTTASAILLLNLLIAQLNCSYVYIYQNMVGFARLKRAEVIVDTLTTCPKGKWQKFIDTLGLDVPLEFAEGDVGMAGGIQVGEPAHAHPVAADTILRFGGKCSPDMQWPDADGDDDDEADETRFQRVEALCQKALRRLAREDRRGGRAGGSSRGSSYQTGSSVSLGIDSRG